MPALCVPGGRLNLSWSSTVLKSMPALSLPLEGRNLAGLESIVGNAMRKKGSEITKGNCMTLNFRATWCNKLASCWVA